MLGHRVIFAVVVLLSGTLASAGTTVENIRVWAESGRTRVVLDLSRPADHKIFTLRSPDRLVIDLDAGRLSKSITELPGATGSIAAIRSGIRANGQLRIVIDLRETVRSRSFTAGPNSKYGDRLVVDLQRFDSLTTVKRASEKYARGRDVVIAVDAGHGGHDPGAVGRGKTREKDVALSISRLLAQRINAEPGMKAVLVRNSDRYVDHRARMEVARRSKADLFISIHADAVDDRRASGATVYVLSLKGASDEAAQRLAKRENAGSRVGDVTLAGKGEVLVSVLLDLSQNAALGASLDVGADVIGELARIGKVHRRSVQQAGLIVLKSPDVPSILVETAYISNPAEEKKLRSASYQNKLANAIHSGVRKYFHENPPANTQIALNQAKYNRTARISHVIARGDTLSEIAERYHVSMSAIRSANHLASDAVRIGQKLKIPASSGT
jgi:N-acetylmuramoyl-L-alanine amidase